MKRVKKTTCGIKCIDLTIEAVKILGFSIHMIKKIELEKHFLNVLLDSNRVLKIWQLRNLTFEGKAVIFKTLALSRIVFLAQILPVPNEMIEYIQCIQKDFLRSSSTGIFKVCVCLFSFFHQIILLK